MKLTLILVALVVLMAPSKVHSIDTVIPAQPILDPALQVPCACESTGSATGTPTQYAKNGDVLHGKDNPHDIGMCQINNDWNGKEATEMGDDIYTEDGNIRFANYLYETQGLEPWHWSKPCWEE